MLEDLWNHRLATAEVGRSGLKTELAKIERDVEQFLDRIAQAQLPSVVTAYENHIRRLEEVEDRAPSTTARAVRIGIKARIRPGARSRSAIS